jgi:uncharacterized repeat protein (TIGR02543 family)
MNAVSNNKAVVLAITFVLVSVAFITVGNARIETDFIDLNNDKIVKSENPANYSPLVNCSLVIKLPANLVTLMVQHTSTNSYFNSTLSDVPLGYDISNGSYLGWCIDLSHSIADNTFYQVYLYSSYNKSMPSYLWHNNLSKVNYILNNKQGSTWQVQKAIWYILDFGDSGLNSDGWAMINDTIANGSDFCPGVGDIIAIIADAGTGVQYTVIELQVPVYTLTVNTDGNGSVTPPGGMFTSGTNVTLTAIADTNWIFDHWSGNLTGNNNPDSILMTSNKTITAHFTEDAYTLTINIDGNGTVTKDPDQEYYAYGTLVELTATPDTGCDFSYWSGNISGSGNPITINMISDKEVTAHFTENEYKLTINIDESGSVIKDPDQNTYPNETVVTLTVVADAGWTFSHWSGNLTGSTNPDNITMDGDKTVTAHFKKSSGGSSQTNQNPSAEANGPYSGFINEEITFDGSGSTDDAGIITNYTWDFGDSATGYGVNPMHVYSTYGEYIVILTVTDDDGATDTDETTALISQPNRPPTTPIVDGITDGTKNTKYTYTSVSTDPDNDTIQYTFDWDDGETNTSEFLANGTATIQIHKWTSPGKYTITVEAYDNETYSGTASHIVLIDAHIVDDIGYITDDDADGVYDTFHNTDLETGLGRDEDNYLIDNNGDGEWDYVYNPDTEKLMIYEIEPTPEKEEEEKEEYAGIIILAIIMILLIIVFSVLIGRKKGKKKKLPPKKTGKKTTNKKTKKAK